MTGAVISRRALMRAVADRCAAAEHAVGYIGQVGSLHGISPDTPSDPPTKSADDQRVQPYFVIFPGIGAPTDEDSVDQYNRDTADLVWPVQVTAAGGDVDDVLALVDRLDRLLLHWSPGRLDGVLTGPLTLPLGYVPPLLTDQQFKPRRFFVPLQYRLTAHT